jgi:type IV pilus assembly protein PilF
MRILQSIILFALLLLLSACAAVSVAGLLASTGASAAVRAIDDQMQENALQAPQRQQVAEANLNVAVEFLRRGNYEGALERLKHAQEADPKNSFIYSMFGMVYQRIGDIEQAEKNFRRSLELEGDRPENLNNYGQFLCQQGRADEAEKLFLKAAQDRLYQTPEVALTNAGLCAQRGGDIAKATGYFNAALTANPAAVAALLALSEVELGNDRIPEAHKLLERYLKVASHTPRSLWLGIRIAGKLGDKDTEASYSMLLRNKYPDSVEAGYLKDGRSS